MRRRHYRHDTLPLRSCSSRPCRSLRTASTRSSALKFPSATPALLFRRDCDGRMLVSAKPPPLKPPWTPHSTSDRVIIGSSAVPEGTREVGCLYNMLLLILTFR